MNWKWFLFSFDGRISRKSFWLFNVVLFVLYMTLRFAISGNVDISRRDRHYFIYVGIFLWPALAIQIKRWHDRNKSGVWILINSVPLVGVFWSLIELGFLEGTVGENRFGKDPIEGVQRGYNFSREFTGTQNYWAFGFLFLILFSVFAWAILQVFLNND